MTSSYRSRECNSSAMFESAERGGTQTSDGPLLDELADALESAQAELRQERERAQGLLAANASLVDAVYATDDDLARARELILQAVKLYDSKPPYKPGLALEMRQTIRPALDYLDKGEKPLPMKP